MKKTALFIILCILLSNFSFVILSFADSNTDLQFQNDPVMSQEERLYYINQSLDPNVRYSSSTVTYDNFLTAYYDNLTTNIGMNYKGSCGYVALAMLLSYYDTYLNDEIIPEQYDVESLGDTNDIISRRNSPGIYHDIITNPKTNEKDTLKNLNASEYYDIIEDMADYSFHAKLITIGNMLGYYNFNDNSPASTSIYSRMLVLNYYLNSVAGISSRNYSISYIEKNNDDQLGDSVKQYTINMIEAGYPVLLSLVNADTNSGHAVIAYDYNRSTGEIYCHFGYNRSTTHTTPEERGYTIYRNAMAINFNIEHSHTNNYIVSTITDSILTNQYYCYDNCSILTYTPKEHIYGTTYEQHDNSTHKSYCECGDYILELHITEENCCIKCMYTHTEHIFDRWVYYSKTNHIEACFCGATGSIKKSHAVSASVLGRYKPCIDCGTLVDTFSDISQIESVGCMVTQNGSYILPDGIIVLVDADIEAYYNGTLIFYNSNNSALDS